MTGVRELVEVRVVRPVPELVRLSILGAETQLDVSLPLDAPLASLVPELVKLVRSRETNPRETNQSPAPDDTSTKEAKREYWVLSRFDDDTPLPPDATLREAGVANGEQLRLTAERALSAPALYDDVVDAAARLNKAAYAGWDATAARWMAFVGLHLASLAWVFFLVGDAFRPNRPVLVGISLVVALALVGVAAFAYRSYQRRDVGAALGWAAIPISAAVTWALLSDFGGYGLAAGCAVLIAADVLFFRLVGTGHWGYLASGMFFALCGIAFAAHAAGLRADILGAALSVLATLACLAVPRLTVQLTRFEPPAAKPEPEREEAMFENPFVAGQVVMAAHDGVSLPTAEDVWARVRFATLTRSALYTGLAAGAGAGAAAVLVSQAPVKWSGLTLALACAAALGLYARRPTTGAERAALGIPATGLVAVAGLLAQGGAAPIALTAFGVLLALVVAFAVIGTKAPSRPPERVRTSLTYLEYLASAALIPLALWVVGVYGRLGIG